MSSPFLLSMDSGNWRLQLKLLPFSSLKQETCNLLKAPPCDSFIILLAFCKHYHRMLPYICSPWKLSPFIDAKNEHQNMASFEVDISRLPVEPYWNVWSCKVVLESLFPAVLIQYQNNTNHRLCQGGALLSLDLCLLSPKIPAFPSWLKILTFHDQNPILNRVNSVWYSMSKQN